MVFELKKWLFILLALAVATACNRVEQGKRELSQKIQDRFFPKFDHDRPDTENNRQRFRDFLKVEITPDITGIYCHDDAIGIDADYMFAFKCSPETAEKIIQMHEMVLDEETESHGFFIQDDFEWWDKERIATLPQYTWTDGDQYFKYFWYDPETGKAYFFDFDV